MNPVLRWTRFNLVGALGMGVQLGTLALLDRQMPGHYLVATALALEITLLHNFAWHVVYTWRDRRVPQWLEQVHESRSFAAEKRFRRVFEDKGGKLASLWDVSKLGGQRVPRVPRLYANSTSISGPLVRFHLTNGLVSYAGNLALMRLLVEGAHMPVLAANGIAVVCCSILNFLLADRWAFVAPDQNRAAPGGPNPVTLSTVLPPAPN